MSMIIQREYEEGQDFIKVLNYQGDKKRNFASKVMAFNFGYENLTVENYDYIGCLDADITLESDYYERIMEKFRQDINIGIAGGYVKEPINGVFKNRRLNKAYSMPNSIQFLSRSCFDEIGGFLPLKYGGEDVAAEVMARQRGWKVRAFPDIPVFHHRVASSAQGLPRGMFRQGKMDYHLGNFFLSELLMCGNRIISRPFLIGAMARMMGYIVSYIKGEERIVDSDFIEYFRKEQWDKIFHRFAAVPILGKLKRSEIEF